MQNTWETRKRSNYLFHYTATARSLFYYPPIHFNRHEKWALNRQSLGQHGQAKPQIFPSSPPPLSSAQVGGRFTDLGLGSTTLWQVWPVAPPSFPPTFHWPVPSSLLLLKHSPRGRVHFSPQMVLPPSSPTALKNGLARRSLAFCGRLFKRRFPRSHFLFRWFLAGRHSPQKLDLHVC